MKSKSVFPVFIIIVLLALAVPNILNIIRGPAKTPGIFEQGYSLSQASQISQDSGKPMLVLVTADWCPPCQKLKRSTMIDPDVVSWVNTNTVPVYLEADTNPSEIRTLPVQAYPTTLLIQDGQVLASLQGAVGSSRYIEKLSSAMIPTP